MPPTRLIYVSTRLDRTPEGLNAIFESSRRNNLRDDINGVLIVSDTHFVQVLEGSYDAVSQCMERIAQDRRHHEIRVVSSSEVSFRVFAMWSMRRIDIAGVKEWRLEPFLVDGVFQPMLMSQNEIQNLCWMLSQERSDPSGSAAEADKRVTMRNLLQSQ